jgi:hypothetical protein
MPLPEEYHRSDTDVYFSCGKFTYTITVQSVEQYQTQDVTWPREGGANVPPVFFQHKICIFVTELKRDIKNLM